MADTDALMKWIRDPANEGKYYPGETPKSVTANSSSFNGVPLSAGQAFGNAFASYQPESRVSFMEPARAGSTPAPTQTQQTPTPTPVMSATTAAAAPQQPAKDYAALAAARTAAALAQKRTIAAQQTAAADAAFQQQQKRTQDSRILQDSTRTQTASPFANVGRTSFNEGLIGRERTQADADAASALATQKANIQQLLADYENATADERVRIADELERADRDYQLQLAGLSGVLPDGGATLAARTADQNYALGLAGLTGNIDGGRTLQGQQLDWNMNPNNPANQAQAISNQINQLKLQNLPEELRLGLEKLQTDVDTGKLSQQEAKYRLTELTDPNSTTNQAKTIDLELAKLNLQNAPEEARLRLQQLQKTIANIGAAPYRSPEQIEMDKVKLATAQEELKQLQNPPAAKGATAADYYKELDSSIYLSPEFAKDPSNPYAEPVKTGKTTVNNPEGLETYIYSLNLPNAETYKLLQRYGLVK